MKHIQEVELTTNVSHLIHSLTGILTQVVTTPGCMARSIKHLTPRALFHLEQAIGMYLVRDVIQDAQLCSWFLLIAVAHQGGPMNIVVGIMWIKIVPPCFISVMQSSQGYSQISFQKLTSIYMYIGSISEYYRQWLATIQCAEELYGWVNAINFFIYCYLL